MRDQEPPLVMFRHDGRCWRLAPSPVHQGRRGPGGSQVDPPQPDLAWNNARLLWAVRDDPLARGLFLDSLAASTALASRMLLVAV